MRKAFKMMAVRLSAVCPGHVVQPQALQSMSTGGAGARLLPLRSTLRVDSTAKLYGNFVSGGEHGLLKTRRATPARAVAAQYSAQAAVTEDEYVVQSMPWDPMAANAVSLIGNTGRDVEIKRLETGKVVGSVTLACAHKAGQTTWHDIEIWGPMAERIAEQVPKGSRICVQGKLNPATWTNREGVKQTKLRIAATEVRFIQREQQPPGAQQQGGWGQQQQQMAKMQGWGQPQNNTFEQAPPPGAEWGRANNVVPGQETAAPAGPLTKESSAEEKWQSVIDNPQLWWNNTANKRNPKAPDFKLKNDPTGSVVLWITNRDTPEWARQKLESSGISPAYQPSGFTDMN